MNRTLTAVLLAVVALSLAGCDNVEKKTTTSQSAKADTVKFPIVFECEAWMTASVGSPGTRKIFVVLDYGADGLTVSETPGDIFLNNDKSTVELNERLLDYSLTLKDRKSIHSIDRLTGSYSSYDTNTSWTESGTGTCKVKKDKLF